MSADEGDADPDAGEGDMAFVREWVGAITDDLPPEYADEARFMAEELYGEDFVAPDREMAAQVPENAINIPDPSAAPPGAQTVQGPRGGWYYIPIPGAPVGEADEGSGGEDDTAPVGSSAVRDVMERVDQTLAEFEAGELPNFVATNIVSRHLNEITGIEFLTLPVIRPQGDEEGLDVEATRRMATAIARAGEAGITQNVETLGRVTGRDAYAFYQYRDNRMFINSEFSPSMIQGNAEHNFTVADGYEWFICHELGHGQHALALGDQIMDIAPMSTSDFPGREGFDEDRTRDRLDTAESVSIYARKNAGEFVAEVFAGLCLGMEFSDDVMEMYDQFGGPDTWRSYREAFHPDGYDPDRALQNDDAPELPDHIAESADLTLASLTDPDEADEADGDDREMAAQVPENAVPIPGPEAAPEGTQTVQGPRGGWYYVPTPGAGGVGEEEGGEPNVPEADEHPPNPGRDVPRFREDPELTAKVEALHEVQYENGFTLNADLTEYDGLGYVATITSENRTHPEAGGEGVTKDDIVDLYQRMQGVLREFPAIAKLGTFYGDGGYMSIDLNIVTEDRALAETIGQANNQQAVWDLFEMKPIDTGGDGNSPVDPNDPEAVLNFVREVVEQGRGREAQALAGLNPDAATATMTEYETESGERVSGLLLFGKIKSGVWDVVDTTDDGLWAVRTEDGETMILAPVEEDDTRQASAPSANTDEFVSPFKQVPASDDYTEAERAFHTMYEEVLWDDQADGKELFAASRLPENVKDRMIDAIQEGALFDTFEAMTETARADFREWLLNEARSGGWTIREGAERLTRIDPTLSFVDAERIMRTETQAIVTTAREMWYEQEGDFVAEDTLFVWQGPQDHRTTDACTWLKEQTNPRYGGEPVTLERMQELVEEAQDSFFPDLDNRRWTVHPYERHTIVRYYAI